MEQRAIERPETPLDSAPGPESPTDGTGGRRQPAQRRLVPRGRKTVTLGTAKFPPSQAKRIRRVVFRTLLVGLAIVLTLVGISIGHALTRPGNDRVAARLAEWGRDHRLGSAVDWLERKAYHPPKVGGTPESTSPLVATPPFVPANPDIGEIIRGPQVPSSVVPLASPALADEGVWQSLASAVGQPVMAATFLRPDALHTAYTAGMVWWDPSRVKAALHPGTLDPGGTWSEPNELAPGNRTGVLAAFNSGFRLDASRGGYYADGRVARPLVDGAASMIFRSDGTMTVGKWGRDATLTGDVAAVRQNLALIVDDGSVVPGVETNVNDAWGATIGNAKFVWRSGLGVRADGGMVYVAGDRLTAQSLAQLLVQAGSARGMELDINPDWTSFVRYMTPQPTNLLPDMQNSPTRYDKASSRDFVSLSSR